MNAIVPHIFEDYLVRSVIYDKEPWFIGRDVCHVLEIKNESQALARLDTDERAEVCIPDPSGAKTAIAVSEPGVFRLIFTSRKPSAERFKRWIAHDVLPNLRPDGSIGDRSDHVSPQVTPVTTETAREIEIKLAMVNTAARIFGAERARAVWREQGLSPVPVPAPGGDYEALQCLEHIFSAQHEGQMVIRLLRAAMDDDKDAAAALKRGGLWAEPDRDGFVVANRHGDLSKLFEDTAWRDNRWCYVLRRLPGALREKARRFVAGETSRGVFIPGHYIDSKSDIDGRS